MDKHDDPKQGLQQQIQVIETSTMMVADQIRIEVHNILCKCVFRN